MLFGHMDPQGSGHRDDAAAAMLRVVASDVVLRIARDQPFDLNTDEPFYPKPRRSSCLRDSGLISIRAVRWALESSWR